MKPAQFDTHEPGTCNKWCKTHWYFDHKLKGQRRYPQPTFHEIDWPVDGKKQWSETIVVHCGPPAYYPKKPQSSLAQQILEEKKDNSVAVTGISTALYAYFQKHANEIVSADQIEAHFKGKYGRRQIMSNIRNLMKTKAGAQISSEQVGFYVFSTKPTPATSIQERLITNQPGLNIPVMATPDSHVKLKIQGELFEKIRELKDDDVLLVSEDGELWRAKKVQF